MTPGFVPAVFMRGGTSKGVFFREDALPPPGPERDRLLLAVLGSPDPYGRQLDGMGGGISSLSKVISVQPSLRADADIDFTFGQVAITQPVVDYSANCGNLSAAVGPFAVNEGLVPPPADGPVTLRIHNTNTGTVIRSTFHVSGGTACQTGDLAIPGVAATGPSVKLDYLSPGGSTTGALLPTGAVTTELTIDGSDITISCVDATIPLAIVSAKDVGLTGAEPIAEIGDDSALMATLDQVRRAAAVAMGMAATPTEAALASPKVAIIGPPAAYRTISDESLDSDSHDLSVRMISMEQVHRAVPGIGALCLAVAAQIPGTVAHQTGQRTGGASLRLGTPSGVVTVAADIAEEDGRLVARTASMYRTARTLMRGEVATAT